MCISYETTSRTLLNNLFEARILDGAEWRSEVYQDYVAPIIRHDVDGSRQALLANYSMIPKSKLPPGVKRFSTMNARAETIGQLRSYAKPWREGKLCLVPMQRFFEPCYESGKAERWAIGLRDVRDFAVAGLYKEWLEDDGSYSYSFTQITINSDEHALMRRMHKPGEEKRSLVVVDASDYDDWLSCKNPEFARSFLQLYPAELMSATPAPLASKGKAPPAEKKQTELF
jgi:putative SOS response-associated peptidase YedK